MRWLRLWMFVCAAFEVKVLRDLLLTAKPLEDVIPFIAMAPDSDDIRRAIGIGIAYLMATRLAYVWTPEEYEFGVLAVTAAIHVLEAFYVGYEFYRLLQANAISKEGLHTYILLLLADILPTAAVITLIVFLNAVWLTLSLFVI